MGFLWALWQSTKVCLCVFLGIPLLLAMFLGLIIIPVAAIEISAWYLLCFLLYPVAGALLYWLVELAETVGHYW